MVRVIGVISGKGGVGKTTIVANLALSLRDFGQKVVAIDCNITTPHLSSYIGGYNYNLHLNDVLKDKVVITSASYYHNGILLVPSSKKLEDLIDVDITKLKDSMKALNDIVDVILLDSAPSLGREALSVLDASDEIIFVTTPLLPAVEDIIKCNTLIKRVKKKVLGIVLNMVKNESYELSGSEVEALTGIPVIAEVPFDENILNGLKEKTPVIQYKPKSPASVICVKLAARILGEEFEERKGIISSFYDAIKRITPFKEAVKTEEFEESVKTDADKILDIVKTRGSIKVSELANLIGLSKKETKDLAVILKNYDLIEYRRSIFGDRLRLKE